MTTNITINTLDSEVVIYLQDGSSMIVQENSSKSLQLIDGGFCTISEAPADEDLTGEKFVEMMIEFWEMLWAEIKEEADDKPEATPL